MASGLKHRRDARAQAAWLGGFASALTKTQSLISGRTLNPSSPAETRDGPPPPAATATSADTIARVKRRAISLPMLLLPFDGGTIGRMTRDDLLGGQEEGEDARPPLRVRGPRAYMRCGSTPVIFFGGLGGCSVVPFVFAVVMLPVNVGCVRACVFASNPEASLMSVGSLNAVPRKLMPIGIPRTFAAGT